MSIKVGFIFLTVIISVLMVISTSPAGSTNLVINPGFEAVKGKQPIGWDVGKSVPDVSVEVTNDSHSGSKGLTITNSKMNDTMVIQNLKVRKGNIYKITYWLKANIKNQAGSANATLYYVSNNSGCKGIFTSRETMNTNGMWRMEKFYIRTRFDIDDPLTLALRLGGQGTQNQGTVTYDDVVMEEVDSVPSGFQLYELYIGKSQASPGSSSDSSSSLSPPFHLNINASIIWVILGVLFLGLIIFMEHKVKENLKKQDTEIVSFIDPK
jgi:hypothetical protein